MQVDVLFLFVVLGHIYQNAIFVVVSDVLLASESDQSMSLTSLFRTKCNNLVNHALGFCLFSQGLYSTPHQCTLTYHDNTGLLHVAE